MYSFKICLDNKVHLFGKSIFLECCQPGFISTGMSNPEERCNNLLSSSSTEEVGTLFTSLIKTCAIVQKIINLFGLEGVNIFL